MEDGIDQEWKLASMRSRFDVLKIANPKDETLQRLSVDKLNPEKLAYWDEFKVLLPELKILRSKNLIEINNLYEVIDAFSQKITEATNREKVEDVKKESPFCGWLNNKLSVLLNYLVLIKENFENSQLKEDLISETEKEIENLGGAY